MSRHRLNDFSRKSDHKLEQLGRQVQRHLSLVFGELEDPLLAGLIVEAVTAVAGGSTLLVSVRLPDQSGDEGDTTAGERLAVLTRLERLKGRLRSEIATAIHRKRTPQLLFELVDDQEDDGDDSL